MESRRISILGVPVDNISLPEAVERAMAGRRVSVVTPNPIMIRKAQRDPALYGALSHATLSLPDGIGLLWAAKFLSLPLSHRVAGIEFGEKLLQKAAERGRSVYLLGGRPGVADRAAQKLTAHLPGLRICGTQHGYFSLSDSPAISQRIADSGADILFVCLGSPRQELWAERYCPSTVALVASLGGSLDVWAGQVMRAPAAFSALGLEWLWRMCREPRRFSGLTDILVFLLLTVKERLSLPTPQKIR